MSNTTWRVAAAVAATMAPAFAEIDLPDLPQLPAPKAPDKPPKLTIVSPTMDQELTGKATKDPSDQYDSLDCLLDGKKFGIKDQH